ncbi:MAG: DUF3823 domain-containing protein [Tenuifilaceae bacterium]
MKKIIYFLCTTIFVLSMYSCEIDNYSGPDAAIQGQILDPSGNPLQVDQGQGSMKIKMEELTWITQHGGQAITPTYLAVKQDGSYMNTKIFSGTYKMTPIEGPFYPYDIAGDTVKISGKVSKSFTITPYQTVEWVTEPFINAEGYIEATISYTSNTIAGVTAPAPFRYRLFISPTQYVGAAVFDALLTADEAGVTTNPITILSKAKVVYTGRTYYVRGGVSSNDAFKKFNYTDIKTVVKQP